MSTSDLSGRGTMASVAGPIGSLRVGDQVILSRNIISLELPVRMPSGAQHQIFRPLQYWIWFGSLWIQRVSLLNDQAKDGLGLAQEETIMVPSESFEVRDTNPFSVNPFSDDLFSDKCWVQTWYLPASSRSTASL